MPAEILINLSPPLWITRVPVIGQLVLCGKIPKDCCTVNKEWGVAEIKMMFCPWDLDLVRTCCVIMIVRFAASMVICSKSRGKAGN